VLATQSYIIAIVFAATKIVLSGRLNIYFPIYQLVACDRYLGKYFCLHGETDSKAKHPSETGFFWVFRYLWAGRIRADQKLYTVSCIPEKDLLHIKKHATHRGVVNAVVVIEIECKCATKDELRSVRKTSRRRIPSSMTNPNSGIERA
jgi:hypothetical protein